MQSFYFFTSTVGIFTLFIIFCLIFLNDFTSVSTYRKIILLSIKNLFKIDHARWNIPIKTSFCLGSLLEATNENLVASLLKCY